MKSNKQRRAEIREKRLKKATNIEIPTATILNHPDYLAQEIFALDRSRIVLPPGAIAVNPAALVSCSTIFEVPDYYEDKSFRCAACNVEDLWTAKAQRWWYEIAKGNIETTVKYCRPCRIKRRNEAKKSKFIHFSGLVKKHGLEKAAKILQLDQKEIRRIIKKDELQK